MTLLGVVRAAETLGAGFQSVCGQNDRDKAEAIFRDAMRLDPEAVQPKVQLAQLLSRKNPEKADKLIDVEIAANPRSAE